MSKELINELICDLILEIDGNVTYGQGWDGLPENQEVFANCKKLLTERLKV